MALMKFARCALAGALLVGLCGGPASAQLAPPGGPPTGPNGYVAANWYVPKGPIIANAGAAPGSGSIRCLDGSVNRTLTTSNLGIRISTANAGNVQAAIYANSTANRPTGTALVSTASMSTASQAAVSAAAVLQLQQDTIYWFCSNMDNGTAAAVSVATTGTGHISLTGDATEANLSTTAGGTFVGVSTPQAFASGWPDLTSATFTPVTVSVPLIMLQVGSVP